MKQITRRSFLKTATILGGAMALPIHSTMFGQRKIGANDKIRIAAIGIGGMGRGDIGGLRDQGVEFVALCDPDLKQIEKLNKEENRCTDAKIYQDYMKMFNEMSDKFDAVLISAADHAHCAPALEAMKRGKHVYVQKPMAHTYEQARLMMEAAAKYKVVTQMGNQGQSQIGTQEAIKWVKAKLVGDITEIYGFTNRAGGWWPQGEMQLAPTQPVPEGLNWDIYLGKDYTAKQIPFGGNQYHPFAWRGWYMFGCGALGDMAVHICAPAYYALQLGEPTSVYCESSGYSPVAYPSECKVIWEFPARGDMPPVKLTWYESKKIDTFAPLIPEEHRDVLKYTSDDGCTIMVGKKGAIQTATWGANARVSPENFYRDLVQEGKIERKPKLNIKDANHYGNWVRAIRGEEKSTSSFDIAAPFVQTLLLGAIAQHIPGKKLEWDAKAKQFKGSGKDIQYANKLLKEAMPSFPKEIYRS